MQIFAGDCDILGWNRIKNECNLVQEVEFKARKVQYIWDRSGTKFSQEIFPGPSLKMIIVSESFTADELTRPTGKLVTQDQSSEPSADLTGEVQRRGRWLGREGWVQHVISSHSTGVCTAVQNKHTCLKKRVDLPSSPLTTNTVSVWL